MLTTAVVSIATAQHEQPAHTKSFAGRSAVVTGAGSSIGCAIAVALSREGAHVCAVGGKRARLVETIDLAELRAPTACFQIDLTCEDELQPLIQHFEEAGGLDVLVHCAGILRSGLMESAKISISNSLQTFAGRTY